MRRLPATLPAVLIALLTAVALAGCSLFGGDGDTEEQEIARLVEQEAGLTVFLKTGVTDRDRATVEAFVRAMPNVAGVTYESSAEAYAKAQKLFSAEPTPITDLIDEDTLPSSYIVDMSSGAAVREIRDTELGVRLKALPGVQDVIYRCTTMDECKAQYTKRSTPPK